MSLDGGRKLTWEHSFSSESEVKPNRGFWNKLVDVIAGAPDYHFLVRPYSIVTDSRGRIIVTDPGAEGVHIFDFAQHKYKFIERTGKEQGLDADAAMRRGRCPGQYLRHRFRCGQDFCLRAQRKVSCAPSAA